MAMVAESMPKLKGLLRKIQLSDACRSLIIRMVITFIMHSGRMSCSQAAGALATEPRHIAQLTRFLARTRWKSQGITPSFRDLLLKQEAASKGRFVLLLDATSITQQGKKTQNTFSTANRKRRSKKRRR